VEQDLFEKPILKSAKKNSKKSKSLKEK